MTIRASEDTLDGLHQEFARVLTDFLRAEYTSENGQKIPPPAHVLSAARAFLKDNGITGAAVTGSPLDFLKNAALPFSQEEQSTLSGRPSHLN